MSGNIETYLENLFALWAKDSQPYPHRIGILVRAAMAVWFLCENEGHVTNSYKAAGYSDHKGMRHVIKGAIGCYVDEFNSFDDLPRPSQLYEWFLETQQE